MASLALGPRLRPCRQPAARARLVPASRAAPATVRFKSGPYGYTQAKALVYSSHGEPADALKYALPAPSAGPPARRRPCSPARARPPPPPPV